MIVSAGSVYTIVTNESFLFPQAIPVKGTLMNHCIVALGITTLISAVQWLVDARKNFEGPRVTIGSTENVF